MTEQPVDIDYMMGYKTLGDTSLGTAAALVRIGGVAGVQEVPAWADTLLGIYAHFTTSLMTTLQDNVAWGYLESGDGMSIKPFEFLYPPISAALGATVQGNSTPGEYYPINAPVRPLSKIMAYGQVMRGAAATTAAPYAAVTFAFSNSRAAGQWQGAKLDSHPSVQRYRKVGTYTAVPSAADGYFAEAGYQINLGTGGGIISELGGLHTNFTAATSLSGGGTFRFKSNDVPLFPQTFASNAFGPQLGGAGGFDYGDIITRRQCHCEAEGVTRFENEFLQGMGETVLTGDFITMVEFVRA